MNPNVMKEIRSVSFDTSFLLKDDPDVDKIINELIKDGWIPFGDPHFTENHAYQVMVKVEQNNLGIPVIR